MFSYVVLGALLLLAYPCRLDAFLPGGIYIKTRNAMVMTQEPPSSNNLAPIFQIFRNVAGIRGSAVVEALALDKVDEVCAFIANPEKMSSDKAALIALKKFQELGQYGVNNPKFARLGAAKALVTALREHIQNEEFVKVLSAVIGNFYLYGKEGAVEIKKEHAETYVVEALRVHQKHRAVVETIVDSLYYMADRGAVSASIRNAGGAELCQSIFDNEDLPLRVRSRAATALKEITRN